ncbi:MAG TPA: hypothetical protein PKM63_10525 [Panacibacter sp.]|nr:hypothetical protein [Panacibacter sp.]HNP44712.1 hypothetical protein [Panacibacter sp.]
MATNWQQVVDEVKTYRTYYNGLPASASSYKKKGYFISKEELFSLLKQKDANSLLDGIRIYFGANMVEGNMVPTVHVVACEKDASSPDLMNDYNIGDTVPGSATLVADTHPCPIYCGKSNILNK